MDRPLIACKNGPNCDGSNQMAKKLKGVRPLPISELTD